MHRQRDGEVSWKTDDDVQSQQLHKSVCTALQLTESAWHYSSPLSVSPTHSNLISLISRHNSGLAQSTCCPPKLPEGSSMMQQIKPNLPPKPTTWGVYAKNYESKGNYFFTST
ncbi:hypothetical protein XENORESO_003432 [Xenotaenia resolanae]|uniref:Uncharacterized protein n=1 Tax=Xenotaenia resolanae TaxID=208358 RepID=A0ABV0WDT4_9TELE